MAMDAIRKSFPLLLFLALPAMSACAADPPIPHEQTITGVAQAPDGVEIAYESHGSGDAAVVFVHCWGCNRQFWRHQIQPVVEAGYRAVALDLPGHGESGAERTDWLVAGLADDVLAVLDELELDRVALVGHSMGGPVSLALAPKIPGRLIGIVCVDTLHNVEFEWPEGMTEALTQRLEEDYREGVEFFIPQLFRRDADPELKRWVVDQAVQSDHAATIALMGDFPNLDLPAILADAGVPVRCINAAPAGDEGFPTEIEINRRYADFDAEFIEGVGHYPQLERPDEFNEKLLAALAEVAPPR